MSTPDTMQLSVVMSALRASETVQLSIRSTLAALSKIDELILVLEEQDSATLRACSTFARDPRLRILKVEPGSSFAEKLNLGISNARYGWIARMDADDVCLPWRFKVQLRALRKTGASVCCTTAIIFGSSLKPFPVLPQFPIGLNDCELKVALTKGNPIMHPTVVMNKGALMAAGGYRDEAGEDLGLWLRGAQSGWQMIRVGMPGILFRYSKKSMSRSEDTKREVGESVKFRKLRTELSVTFPYKRGNGGTPSTDTSNCLSALGRLKIAIEQLDLRANH